MPLSLGCTETFLSGKKGIVMDVITKLPEKKGIVGTKQIVKAAQSGKIKHIIVAANCPQNLLVKLDGLNVKKERFDGDESTLATKLGKTFPVAMVGFEE
jgi:ribosomal protein L30E